MKTEENRNIWPKTVTYGTFIDIYCIVIVYSYSLLDIIDFNDFFIKLDFFDPTISGYLFIFQRICSCVIYSVPLHFLKIVLLVQSLTPTNMFELQHLDMNLILIFLQYSLTRMLYFFN